MGRGCVGWSVWSLASGPSPKGAPWPTTEVLALILTSHWVPNGFITAMVAFMTFSLKWSPLSMLYMGALHDFMPLMFLIL